jgi:hypothetical protein
MLDAVVYAYLAAFLVGLGVIGLQLLFAGHGDAGGGGHDVAGHDDGTAESASVLVSTRFWTFALLAFGLVGSLLTMLHLASPIVAALLAIAMGIAAGLFAALTMRALRGGPEGSASLDEAVGKTGRVLLSVSKERVGKLRVSLKGQEVDLLATTDGEEIEEGQTAVVSEMRGGIARLVAAPKELDP